MNFRSVAALACLVVASPVLATQWMVGGSGTAFQTPTNPPGVDRIEVPQLQSQSVDFELTINSNVPRVVTPGPGGFGELASYRGAVELGTFFLTMGPYNFQRPEGVPTPFGVANDLRTPTGARQDQVAVSLGTGFAGSVALPPMLVDPELGDDLFVSVFFFGRTAFGTDDALPTLVNSVDFPDLVSLFQPGTLTMSFQLRAGNPTTSAELAALPAAFFTVQLSDLFVVKINDPGAIIPEPGTWAMLIAGFGLVGSALRRRRRIAAA